MYSFIFLRSVGLENIDSWETITKIKTIQYQSPRSLLVLYVLSLTYILKQIPKMLENFFSFVSSTVSPRDKYYAVLSIWSQLEDSVKAHFGYHAVFTHCSCLIACGSFLFLCINEETWWCELSWRMLLKSFATPPSYFPSSSSETGFLCIVLTVLKVTL